MNSRVFVIDIVVDEHDRVRECDSTWLNEAIQAVAAAAAAAAAVDATDAVHAGVALRTTVGTTTVRV